MDNRTCREQRAPASFVCGLMRRSRCMARLGPNNTGMTKTRALQHTLYLAAKRSPNRRFHALFDPTWLKLVHPAGLVDLRERVAELGGRRVRGGEDVLSDADLDGAVAPRGAHEPADGPADALLDQPADRERGEHDAQGRV